MRLFMASPTGIVGRTLGHYRITEQIGAGGMGVVYRARDERLERDVALKVLLPAALSDDAARKRFRKEALALSRLNHPNVATVHDFDSQGGTDFLVTELVPGVTLDERIATGPLQEAEVTQIGLQMADGLEAAHRQGVIHRDLKPGNLRVTPEGRLKILDFGLAKRVGAAEEQSLTQSLSEAVGAVGTLPYMAPEQLRNEKIDARVDLWAAGVVLYEVATGRRPFQGRTSTVVAGEILHAVPEPPQILQPTISPRLAGIILKCLEKDPEDRYQSAKELLIDLRHLSTPASAASAAPPIVTPIGQRRYTWMVAYLLVFIAIVASAAAYFYSARKDAATPQITSLAVLPLAISNSDADSDYLADGITESLINSVSRFPGIQVMARSTVFRYKGRDVDPQTVGRELHVGALVVGHIVARGNTLDVRAELVDASHGTQLWGGRYTRKMTDLLAIQEEIAREIAQALRVQLSEQQRRTLGSSGTSNSEAYQLYLRGRFYHETWSVTGSKLALDYYRQALAKDPSFALAHAGIANSYAFAYAYIDVPAAEALEIAKSEATKALEIDPNLSEAQAALAQTAMWEWKLAEADARFQKAIELNPSNAQARHQYSHYLLAMKRYAASEAQSLKAVELDPISPAMRLHLAFHYLQTRDYPRAESLYHSLLQTEPDYGAAYEQLSQALYYEGKLDEAFEAEVKTERLAHTPEDVIRKGREAYAAGGWPARLRFQLERALRAPDSSTEHPMLLARYYALLGEREPSVHWLQRAYQVRAPGLLEEIGTPPYDSVRSDPRVVAIERSIGVPQ